jgi:curved DNA-binding protein CbpA
MQTPYELLDVAINADDDAIKLAYLQKVKDSPPDRDPEQFQAIRKAYEAIKDHKSRLGHTLFSQPEANFELLLNHALHTTHSVTLNAEQFERLLKISIDYKTLLHALPYSGQP